MGATVESLNSTMVHVDAGVEKKYHRSFWHWECSSVGRGFAQLYRKPYIPSQHHITQHGGTPVTLTLQKDRQQGQEVKGIFSYVVSLLLFFTQHITM